MEKPFPNSGVTRCLAVLNDARHQYILVHHCNDDNSDYRTLRARQLLEISKFHSSSENEENFSIF